MKISFNKNVGSLLWIATASIAILLFSSCQDRVIKKAEYTGNAPLYLTYEDLRTSIKTEMPRNIEHAGKIYIYGKYLFVNEQLKGIHVLDNSDPSNPRNVKFINIPGNIDLAIKENILFVDSYVDLVGLDISDMNDIKEVRRNKDALSYKVPTPEEDYRVARIDEGLGVVTGYEVKEIKEKYEDDGSYYYYGCAFCDFSSTTSENSTISSSSTGMDKAIGGAGVGGSMAGFTVVEDHLYTIDRQELKTFAIADLRNTATENSWRVLETIFPYGDKLFIGTTTGMMVYSITNPAQPSYFSEFEHAESCDPVVVQDDYAYVTLRTGSECGGWSNELNVISIKNLNFPTLSKTVQMTNPHGLGIDGDHLFVCDGEAGLKVYDASEVNNIGNETIASYPNIHAADVIPYNNTLIMVGNDGLVQYDYSDINDIKELSRIEL